MESTSSKVVAGILHFFATAWLVMLVLGANGHATWGYWKVYFVAWAVEAVIAGGVASGLILVS